MMKYLPISISVLLLFLNALHLDGLVAAAELHVGRAATVITPTAETGEVIPL